MNNNELNGTPNGNLFLSAHTNINTLLSSIQQASPEQREQFVETLLVNVLPKLETDSANMSLVTFVLQYLVNLEGQPAGGAQLHSSTPLSPPSSLMPPSSLNSQLPLLGQPGMFDFNIPSGGFLPTSFQEVLSRINAPTPTLNIPVNPQHSLNFSPGAPPAFGQPLPYGPFLSGTPLRTPDVRTTTPGANIQSKGRSSPLPKSTVPQKPESSSAQRKLNSENGGSTAKRTIGNTSRQTAPIPPLKPSGPTSSPTGTPTHTGNLPVGTSSLPKSVASPGSLLSVSQPASLSTPVESKVTAPTPITAPSLATTSPVSDTALVSAILPNVSTPTPPSTATSPVALTKTALHNSAPNSTSASLSSSTAESPKTVLHGSAPTPISATSSSSAKNSPALTSLEPVKPTLPTTTDAPVSSISITLPTVSLKPTTTTPVGKQVEASVTLETVPTSQLASSRPAPELSSSRNRSPEIIAPAEATVTTSGPKAASGSTSRVSGGGSAIESNTSPSRDTATLRKSGISNSSDVPVLAIVTGDIIQSPTVAKTTPVSPTILPESARAAINTEKDQFVEKVSQVNVGEPSGLSVATASNTSEDDNIGAVTKSPLSSLAPATVNRTSSRDDSDEDTFLLFTRDAESEQLHKQYHKETTASSPAPTEPSLSSSKKRRRPKKSYTIESVDQNMDQLLMERSELTELDLHRTLIVHGISHKEREARVNKELLTYFRDRENITPELIARFSRNEDYWRIVFPTPDKAKAFAGKEVNIRDDRKPLLVTLEIPLISPSHSESNETEIRQQSDIRSSGDKKNTGMRVSGEKGSGTPGTGGNSTNIGSSGSKINTGMRLSGEKDSSAAVSTPGDTTPSSAGPSLPSSPIVPLLMPPPTLHAPLMVPPTTPKSSQVDSKTSSEPSSTMYTLTSRGTTNGSLANIAALTPRRRGRPRKHLSASGSASPKDESSPPSTGQKKRGSSDNDDNSPEKPTKRPRTTDVVEEHDADTSSENPLRSGSDLQKEVKKWKQAKNDTEMADNLETTTTADEEDDGYPKIYFRIDDNYSQRTTVILNEITQVVDIRKFSTHKPSKKSKRTTHVLGTFFLVQSHHPFNGGRFAWVDSRIVYDRYPTLAFEFLESCLPWNGSRLAKKRERIASSSDGEESIKPEATPSQTKPDEKEEKETYDFFSSSFLILKQARLKQTTQPTQPLG